MKTEPTTEPSSKRRSTWTPARRAAQSRKLKAFHARNHATQQHERHYKAVKTTEANSTHEIRIAVRQKNAPKLIAVLMRLPDLIEAFTITRPADSHRD
jgi:hypothetical protein